MLIPKDCQQNSEDGDVYHTMYRVIVLSHRYHLALSALMPKAVWAAAQSAGRDRLY